MRIAREMLHGAGDCGDDGRPCGGGTGGPGVTTVPMVWQFETADGGFVGEFGEEGFPADETGWLGQAGLAGWPVMRSRTGA